MTDHCVDIAIRRAIGGREDAIAWIVANAQTSDDAVVIAMAALLEQHPNRLTRAQLVAATSRDRQVVAIARAHLDGHSDLVDALAREHLVDYPDSLIVAWIASNALVRTTGNGPD
jgi:hypothetical protein